jgi:transcriptional regulator with XRE-family HTH domain
MGAEAVTGSELKKLRLAAGWSQSRVADLAECGLRSIMRWEGTDKAPNKAPVPLHSAVLRLIRGELEAAAARRK